VGKVPPAVSASGPLAALTYAFDTWGWDCIVSGVVQTPDKQLAFDFLMPAQRYALSLVAVREVIPRESRITPLGAWSLPFDRWIWTMLAALILFSGALMYNYERFGESTDDFGPDFIHWSDRVGRGFYKACSNWTAVGGFAPVTPAGRVYGLSFAFVMLLMQSAYTANLAAFFVHVTPPAPRVATLAGFVALKAPACVAGADPVHAAWLASNHPELTQQLIPGSTTDLLAAVAAGTCVGGLAPDPDLAYALGASNDPMGLYCSLEVIQTGFGMNTFAIPMRRGGAANSTDAHRALNAVVAVALAYGDYGDEEDAQFSDPRPLCTNLQAIRDAAASTREALAPLGTRQLGGIFFLQGCGMALSVCIYAIGNVRPLKRAWDAVRGLDSGEDMDAAAEAAEKAAEAEAAKHGIVVTHHHRGRKQIPLSAMLTVERALENALKQFNDIAQTQRELDVPAILASVASARSPRAAPSPHHAAGTPLAVVSKIERALAFGLRAVGQVVLFDSQTTEELFSMRFDMPSSDALATSYANMGDDDADALEEVLGAFLKRAVARRRKATRRLAAAARAKDGNGNGNRYGSTSGR
jgi:hypothetical protein